MSDKQQSISDFLAEEAKKWTARTVIAGAVATCVFMLTPLNIRLSGIWNSPEKLSEISTKIDTLSAEIQKATGEDRVIYETPGLTYVTEPVYVGDAIVLHMVVRMTRLGAACTMISRTPLFVDDTNIATPGIQKRAERQVGTTDTPLRIPLDVPPELRSGRVTVHLSLEFQCGDRIVYDQTRPTPFMLLPKGS